MSTRGYELIDTASIPKHFDSRVAERRWHEFWQQHDVYRFDADSSSPLFVVDTPPPTVSGSLHIGHVFSYTHADIIVRFRRMTGRNIYYPMGWDDNGLPTERRVQHYYHVKCEPSFPYEPGLEARPATAKIRKKPARPISRRNFIEFCRELTLQDEEAFKELWQRTGLSVDWDQTYATIGDHARRVAQMSFLDLYEKGHIYSNEAPTMWDVDFQTAVAQAELEDREEAGAYHHVAFGVEGDHAVFTIATTRPELLAACVGVTAHPDDPRYRNLFGKRAITPLYRIPVPIFPSELADKEKGSGILMVCTFGDATDVEWWRKEGLALRQILGRDGRLMPVDFAGPAWPSLDPARARKFYAEIEGKPVHVARKIVVEQLRSPEASAGGDDSRAPLRAEPETITHPVKYYEKGSRPIEFVSTRQWFVRLMDKKAVLIEKARRITWHPDYMRIRFENWTENLQFDWCISRQRYFGVGFPLWYPLDEEGRPGYDDPILARVEDLPLDPMIDTPPGFEAAQRDKPGGFTAESDVFDTWFTSSMSPQIMSGWKTDPARHAKLFPMDMRPQAHEIIRTWAFYTIVKAALHEDTIPWRNAVISGFIVDPDRKKMSKSKGNVVTPMEYLEKYSADGVRYWAAQANLGTDTIFDEQMMKIGRRLVTKIYNAGKFVLSQSGAPAPIASELDRGFIAHLRRLVDHATGSFERFEFARAISATEDFFWHRFTDTYLELVKIRARSEDSGKADSAVAGLRRGLSVLLRLFAPFLPYIAEEVWSWAYAKETGAASIHRAAWPTSAELDDVPPPDDDRSFDVAVDALAAIHKHKTLSKASAGARIVSLTLASHSETISVLGRVADDVMEGARVERYELLADDSIPNGTFEIREARFASD